jgi:hypothetical protein
VPLLELKANDHFVACHFPQVRADIAAAVEIGITAEEITAEEVAAEQVDVAVAAAAPAPAQEDHPE